MARLNTSADAVDWVRPADWLPLPTITASDSKFAGLVAVFEHGQNFLALTATGNFTVDWGDGSATENISTGVTAQHQYTYSSISSSTLCSRGYKQCVVTVVPNGGNLVSINLQKRHSTASAVAMEAGWLDIALSLTAGAASRALTISANTSTVRLGLLESVKLFNIETVASLAYLFKNCYVLEYMNLFNTSGATSFSNIFNGCSSLKTIPLLNTSGVTTFASCFANCYNLRTIPLLNTSAASTFSSMFYQCLSLKSIPAIDTSAGTAFDNMFYSCTSISALPALSTSLGQSFASAFQFCYTLTYIPALNFNAATSLSNVFGSCFSITKSAVTNTKLDISYASCNLSATELDAIYTALPTVTAKTITVTSNYGAASDDPTIATAKGWTVTG